ncbi:hypothetical protein PF005_g31499 [Phytophthora fragariae]|uniref:Uncharacterized protein n=1 Tax=Phytophthora fragariae TaxID=53985 RepID=A0A6A3PJV5_9STRA|nr:hypothetical protein PF006_g31794 [Phytophthora fragariae]KAE9160795.1 hypothetical protein PF005_g31499 [Phytophthora fragariae]
MTAQRFLAVVELKVQVVKSLITLLSMITPRTPKWMLHIGFSESDLIKITCYSSGKTRKALVTIV